MEALLAGQGVDAKEVVADLRSHIMQMADSQAGALVAVPDVKRMLGTMGTPEDVASSWSELGKEPVEQNPWAAPYLNPPEEQPRKRFPLIWVVVGVLSLIVYYVVFLPISWPFLNHDAPSEPELKVKTISAKSPITPEFGGLLNTRGPLFTGWVQAGTNHTDYVTGGAHGFVGIDEPTMFIRSSAPEPSGFSTVMHEISAENYRGGPVTVTAIITGRKITGWAGLWLRIDGPNQKPLGFDNMQDRPIVGTREAATYTVTLDVPETAQSLAYGVLLEGPGTVWFSEPRFTPDKHAKAFHAETPGMYTEAFLEAHDADYFFQRMAQPDSGYHQLAGLWGAIIKADRASKPDRDAIIGRALGLAQDARNPFQQRFQCCYVVSSFEDPGTIPYLEALLQNDGDSNLRGVVACALGHFEAREADDALRRALSNERDPGVRKWIERALAGEFPRPKLPEPGSGPQG